LEKLGANADVERAKESRKLRAGKGKMRSRRYVVRRGPLLVYGDESAGAAKAFRNLPGVDHVHVHRLNLLQVRTHGRARGLCVRLVIHVSNGWWYGCSWRLVVTSVDLWCGPATPLPSWTSCLVPSARPQN
jgi:hypothetical protein